MHKALDIIFENQDLLVINKPAGLMVHPDGKSSEYTLADLILKQYPELKGVGEPWLDPKGNTIYRPGIVHRLDKETSGVLLIAKSQEYFEFLKSKFKSREIQKEYRAIVYGSFSDNKKEGVINKKIGRSKKFGVFTVEPFARGTLREATTRYKVLAQSGSKQDEGHAYVAVHPKTGRTHQIRVHLKSVQHPIVCDKLYAPKKECDLGMQRLALHAYKISFKDTSGELLEFLAPEPNDFKAAVELLQNKTDSKLV